MSDMPDSDLNKEQLRALAIVLRHEGGGADGFARSLVKARRLAGHALRGDALWRRICEEISLIETNLALNRIMG